MRIAALLFAFFLESLFDIRKQVFLFLSCSALIFSTFFSRPFWESLNLRNSASMLLPLSPLGMSSILVWSTMNSRVTKGTTGDIDDSHLLEAVAEPVSLFDRECKGFTHRLNRGWGGVLVLQDANSRGDKLRLRVKIGCLSCHNLNTHLAGKTDFPSRYTHEIVTVSAARKLGLNRTQLMIPGRIITGIFKALCLDRYWQAE